jgi:hypothetical protein
MTPISPRERFLQDKDGAKIHSATVGGITFERAADMAMLQFSLNLPVAGDAAVASANHFRLQGAQRFLLELMTIGDPLPLPPDKPDAGLNYDTAPKP